MRRALVAGLILGIVAGLLFVNHETLSLPVAWPMVLGLALWETVGRRGARGAIVAVAAAAGAAMGYATFTFVAQFLPVTSTGLGIAVGVALGVLVAAGLLLRERLPLPAMLIGYAAFLGVFQSRWEESASNIRVHGLEDFTVTVLGVLVGILVATLLRMVVDQQADGEREPGASRDDAVGEVAMKGGTS